jgi:hypothetical protein
MGSLRRRVERLTTCMSQVDPPLPVDVTVLSAAEWDEVARMSAKGNVGGFAALTNTELDRLEWFARRLSGEVIAPCLA